MKYTKKTLAMAGASTLVGLAAFAGVASAQTGSGGVLGTTGQQSLVEKIAAKFNLNKADVQQVFDEDRSTHEAEHQQRLEERLTQAVTDGKITSAQKDQIIAKQKELQTYMDSLKDKTPEERHTLMKTKLDELRQWAEDNNLTDYFPTLHLRVGPGGDNLPANADSTTPPPAPTLSQ